MEIPTREINEPMAMAMATMVRKERSGRRARFLYTNVRNHIATTSGHLPPGNGVIPHGAPKTKRPFLGPNFPTEVYSTRTLTVPASMLGPGIFSPRACSPSIWGHGPFSFQRRLPDGQRKV